MWLSCLLSKLCAIYFQPAESLWQLLEDWLSLLQIEFDQKSPTETCPNTKQNIQHTLVAGKQKKTSNTLSQDAPKSTDQCTEGALKSDDKYKDGVSSETLCHEGSPKQRAEEMLKHMSLEDQDVIGATLPRICGVVQAFYITCSCHSQSGWVTYS